MNIGIGPQVTALIAATLGVDPAMIRSDATLLEDLGADSLALVSLILAIEDEFRIDVHDEDAPELQTVEQMIEYVTIALATKEAPIASGIHQRVGLASSL